LTEAEADPKLKAGLEACITKRYRDRKADAKAIFENEGGYADVERALRHVPKGMTADNWRKAVEYFQISTIFLLEIH